MKTPILTYSAERTAQRLDASIERNLQTCIDCAKSGERAESAVRNMLYNLCYKTFSVSNTQYVDGRNYTVADICLDVVGILQNQLIQFIHNMIDAAQCYTTAPCYMQLLRDCMSYEILQMLYKNPVKIYAALLYAFATLIDDSVLAATATKYLSNSGRRPTLEWEDMYLKYTERYGNDE